MKEKLTALSSIHFANSEMVDSSLHISRALGYVSCIPLFILSLKTGLDYRKKLIGKKTFISKMVFLSGTSFIVSCVVTIITLLSLSTQSKPEEETKDSASDNDDLI